MKEHTSLSHVMEAASKVGRHGHCGDPSTGALAVDTTVGAELTSTNIDSAAGIFTRNAAENLGGSFDNDSDGNIFKAMFGGSFAVRHVVRNAAKTP